MKSYKFIILLTSIFLNTNLHADTMLRLTHQWPGNTGDLRHEMAKIIQNELKKSNLGVGLKIDAKDQLKMRPWQQWSAMLSGTIDMSVYPLAYAGPNHPAFNLTLMPGIIKNHEHARRFNQSKVMQKIKSIINDAGVIVIADLWLAGGMVSNKHCIENPEDAKGLWMRSAGITYNQMLAKAGARIASMPSSKIRQAMLDKELDGAITSSSSLVSYKIYDATKCLIAPHELAIWFMYEPILMSKNSFNKLNEKQQQAIMRAGKKAEEFGFHEAKRADQLLIDVYTSKGITVKKLTKKQFLKWRDVAEDSSYEMFRKEVRNGKELLSMALEVE